MEYVALDMARGMKCYRVAADGSLYVATHDNLLRDQGTRDARPLVDDDVLGVDIAFHLAFDLHLALGFKVTGDAETRTNHRGRVVAAPTGRRPGPLAGDLHPSRRGLGCILRLL